MMSWWQSFVAAVLVVLVPYLMGQVRDALVAAGFDWAWHVLDMPGAVASVWQWLEESPVGSVVLAVAAWLAVLGTLEYRASARNRIDRAFWLDAERALEKVPSELTVICAENTEGLVRWSLYSRGDRGAAVSSTRDRDRFSAEAHRLGLAVRRLPRLPRRFNAGPMEDPIDDWLNVVAALVHAGEGFTGSGHTPEWGSYSTFEIREVVRASRDACVMIANERLVRQEPAIASSAASTPPAAKPSRRRSYSRYLGG